MNKNGYICILDSGIGGVTVLAELLKLMPNESYVYFGDIKNSPYGEKSTDEVRSITLKNIDMLLKKGAKAVVIACNTATGAATREARELHPHVPIVGIEPAIKPAVTEFRGQKVLVMATPLTMNQEKFNILYNRWNDAAEIELLPCPGLASIIEKGHTDDTVLKKYLENLFAKSAINTPSAVVLGCTHYPIVKNEIKKIFPHATVFDGGEGTARQTKRLLESSGLLSDSTLGQLTVETSLNERKTLDFEAKVLDLIQSLNK